MEQELKDQQKRIEDKLDILLAAMSVHPEFGNLVKQGKRELYKTAKAEELRKRIAERDDALVRELQRYLGGPGCTSPLYYRLQNIQHGMSIHISRLEIEEAQRAEVKKAMYDRSAYPEFTEYVDRNLGAPLDFEKELNLIMEEYDRRQETNEQNA